MHTKLNNINVIAFGNNNFNDSINELKDYYNFNLTILEENFDFNIIDTSSTLLVHEDFLIIKKNIESLRKIDNKKIIFSISGKIKGFENNIKLPTSFDELNEIIVSLNIKENFANNSKIIIKDYVLDKNKKQIKKKNTSINLTEKEIQLLELLKRKSPLTKEKILSTIWKYADDADTHTVETHIYRLRRKINENFYDDNFILNNKEGYSI
jgi:hypothetical protein|tara:strand:- start:1758 stop:2387 length:630 start_codon:yes stop_codon:yes gene_type:complete